MDRVHFIGIGGAGMSALAQVLAARGALVSGSDPQSNPATDRLVESGVTVFGSQAEDNIRLATPELVVYSAAIGRDNPELQAARAAGIETISRAAMLGRLMGGFAGPRIAVAGTHGKTTTTAMIAELLIGAGLDPTVLVGGEYGRLGGNVRVGASGMFLTEACEAYESFLELRPDIAIVTNVEPDHLDHYQTSERFERAFAQFAAGIRPGGTLIWCAEDAGASRLACRLASAGSPVRRFAYGLKDGGIESLWAEVDSPMGGEGANLRVHWRSADGCEPVTFTVRVGAPGAHNALNAIGAIAVALAADVDVGALSPDGLRMFHGVDRRFEVIGENRGILVLDDYAHHPTELRATFEAARSSYPGRRMIAVFQPHLYTRTRDFMEEFAAALAGADALVLLDIYPARERPIPGVRVTDLVRRIAEIAPEKTVLFAPTKAEAVDAAEWVARAGDLVMTLGAGDVREVGEALLKRLGLAQIAKV